MKRAAIIGLVLIGLFLASAPTHAFSPVLFWSERFGGTGFSDNGHSVVVDGSGNILVAGRFVNTVDFGGGNLVSAGADDIFLAKYDAAGTHLWSKRFGSTGNDVAYSVDVDGSGNVFVTGCFEGTVNFGGSNLVSAGLQDVFLAKFSPSGSHTWSRRYGGTSDDICVSVAVDGTGNVFITGYYEGVANFGGGNLVSNGSTDIFLAKYDNNSVHQWSGHFGGTGSDFGQGVDTDAAGYVFATGSFSGTVNFGGGNLVSDGGLDVFLMKYSTSAVHQWSQRFGGKSPEDCLDVAVDPSGNVFITGFFWGTANFGGGSLASAGSVDIFVAKYNTNGVHRWSQRFGGASIDQGHALALDGSGNLYVTGYFEDTVDFGGGGLVSAGSYDVFLAKYTNLGVHLWSLRAGDISEDDGRSVAVDGMDNVVATGHFMGTVDFGGDDLVCAGGQDVYLAKFAALEGEPIISSITDIGNDQGRNVLIEFARSGHDDPEAYTNVTQYEAYRRIDPPPAAAAARTAPAGLSPRELLADGWTQVATVAAHGESDYSMVAPTIGDSTIALGQYYSVFYVRAATASPFTFYDSPPDSGYSLDNLAPGVPEDLLYSSGVLTWDESAAADFDYFTVYGGSTDDFGSATLVDYTVDPSMDVTASPYGYYFVTATDFSGNESAPATADALTGAGRTPASYVLSVSNHPNPFNPRTTVRYTVPSRGPVTVAIYDARGTLVVTLADGETRDAGAYRMDWDGRTYDGARAASGVYFARIEHAGATRTSKMVLVK